MNSGPIEDRLAIRELVEQFAAGAMRIDVDYWGETFAEDGSWKLPSMETAAVGREAVKAAFSQKLAYVDYMSMISFPADLVVEGDRARGKAYCRELIFTKTGDQKIVIGYFDDTYVKIQGRWYFQSREYKVMGVH